MREANARLARARDEVRHLEEQTDDLRRSPPVAESPGAMQLRHRRQLIRVAFFAGNSLIYTIGARGIAHEYGWYFAILLSVPVFWAVGLAAEAMERIDE
ncbi:MAG: hypothetical protein JNM17_36185 [Archangium sp.]|nr:hypothetical protein [Archangium sp.]